MNLTEVVDAVRTCASSIPYRGNRPQMEKKISDNQPYYYVRLRFGKFPKKCYGALLQMSKEISGFGSVCICDEGLDMRSKNVDLVKEFVGSLSLL